MDTNRKVHDAYQLDSDQAWSSKTYNTQQWIQVNDFQVVDWNSVIIQGCKDQDSWVTTFKVAFSDDGITWHFYNKGETLKGPNDRNTKVRIDFDCPVRARTLRIVPLTWVPDYISLRFGATFLSN